MARPTILKEGKRINLSIEEKVHAEGKKIAKALRLAGGFSEYVTRLIVRDMGRKRSAAEGVSRHISAAK